MTGAWGVSRVPTWPLWTILLLVWPVGSLGSPLCPQEPFYFLVAIMKMLGNKNDGTLYTPDDLSMCPAETLGCFRLELSVIQFEEGPSVGIAVFRLQRLLDALGARLWVTGQGPCPPCEGHPQRPVPLFLAKLLALLQGACARHPSSA
uniref:Interleukin 15-like protein n=1 Tax=Suricata suricatta TaxID=37032 RepID=A0A673UTB2_SURSU